ncbi:hypothetical protein G7Y41_08555 [Schaalia sp. ZJ405]|uniref:hypothetical protein n=1 Tax=Schaalia sp. ZJ405 TaxID=2709403 RepID=UPI0013E9D821|nr:hypothetical protein [Schaalia sp. ZJ405]QPK81076.1 hypothetical protein G7Y41_08555 [Schaalia sp. ZJ405]
MSRALGNLLLRGCGVLVLVTGLGASLVGGARVATTYATLNEVTQRTSQTQAEVRSLTQETTQVRDELADVLTTKAAHRWCSQMTRENRENLAELSDAYARASDLAQDRTQETCADLVALAQAVIKAPLESLLTQEITSCRLTSDATATITGTVSVQTSDAFSRFTAVDMWVDALVFASNADDTPIASTTVEVDSVPLDGTPVAWETQIPMSVPEARYCSTKLSSWWPH